VLTTAEDLARWLIAQRDGGGGLSPSSVALAHTPAPGRDYAFGWRAYPPGQLSHSGDWFSHTAAQILLPDGHGVAVIATTGLALDNDAETLAQGLATLVQGGSPELALPAGVVADRVLAGLILLSVLLAALGVRHARRWAARRTSPWRAMGVLFAGRRGTFGQVLYVWPGVVGWLGSATLCALVVAAARVRALVSGRQRPRREESAETTGVVAWGSESG
jgi:hypothetical protein